MTPASNPSRSASPVDKRKNVESSLAEVTLGLGGRVRQARRGIDLTQDEFGARLGVTRQSISGYEKGRLLPPTQMIVKIADLTGHNPGWLLFGMGNPSQTIIESQRAGSGSLEDLSRLTETQRYLINYIKEDERAAEKMARLLWKKALEL